MRNRELAKKQEIMSQFQTEKTFILTTQTYARESHLPKQTNPEY